MFFGSCRTLQLLSLRLVITVRHQRRQIVFFFLHRYSFQCAALFGSVDKLRQRNRVTLFGKPVLNVSRQLLFACFGFLCVVDR